MREVNCGEGPMIWIGGSVVRNHLDGSEVFLGFEPNAYYDGNDEGLVCLYNSPVHLPLFEICAYSESEQNLEAIFEKEKSRIESLFSKSCLLIVGNVVKFPPQKDGSGEKHDLDWQMFASVRLIGKTEGGNEAERFCCWCN